MKPVIELEHVKKVYQTGDVAVQAVRDVSLQVLPGEFVAVMGATVCPTSTLREITIPLVGAEMVHRLRSTWAFSRVASLIMTCASA